MNAIMQGYKGRVDGKKLSQAVQDPSFPLEASLDS